MIFIFSEAGRFQKTSRSRAPDLLYCFLRRGER